MWFTVLVNQPDFRKRIKKNFFFGICLQIYMLGVNACFLAFVNISSYDILFVIERLFVFFLR